MKAIVQDTYGSADVLELRDIGTPEIAAGEVLVRVHAAGVDRGVWHLMTGLPYPVRLAGYGLRAPKTPVPGTDMAGVVEAVGHEVTRFQPGDEVFGIGKGTFAEYARAPENKLAPKPANLTFEQAAAVAVSGLTALQGLRDHGRVQPGQTVLIIGASGGVGTFAVQLATAFGAQVTGVCSTTKVDLVRSIGADHVIDYTREDFADGKQRYDVILDIGGNSSLSRLRRALTPKGTLVIVGGETRWPVARRHRSPAPGAAAVPVRGPEADARSSAAENHEDLLVLKELIEAGRITPVIDRTYPLSEAPKAIRYVEQGYAPRKGRHHRLTANSSGLRKPQGHDHRGGFPLIRRADPMRPGARRRYCAGLLRPAAALRRRRPACRCSLVRAAGGSAGPRVSQAALRS